MSTWLYLIDKEKKIAIQASKSMNEWEDAVKTWDDMHGQFVQEIYEQEIVNIPLKLQSLTNISIMVGAYEMMRQISWAVLNTKLFALDYYFSNDGNKSCLRIVSEDKIPRGYKIL